MILLVYDRDFEKRAADLAYKVRLAGSLTSGI